MAKKEGKAAHKGQGPSGHPPGQGKGKWAENKGNKGKSTNGVVHPIGKVKETIKEELEDIFFGKGKGPDKRPPGWDKGNKVGWGDGDTPPGLSHKDKGGKDKSVKEHIKEKIDDALQGDSKKGGKKGNKEK